MFDSLVFPMKKHLASLLLVSFVQSVVADSHEADVVVYGGTSAAIAAAIQVKKMGKSVVVVSPDKHLGGLSSGGLGWTDTGKKDAIGGLAREFYHRVWLEYNKPETWKWQKRSEYGNKGQGTPAIDGENRTMWIFEPSVAEKVFEDFVRDHEITIHRDQWLDRRPGKGVAMTKGRITAITTLSGNVYRGGMFIDATYEGDLLAAAGVDYHVGRESKDTYGEQWNGVQTGVLHHGHHFGAVKKKISPYKVPGDPTSGLLPRINPEHPGKYGDGDKKVQAYCFRMCLTDHPENRVPFPKPKGYDPEQYELLARILAAGWRSTFNKFDRIPNRKTDTNNHGPFSTDNIGMNYDYPEASYERRREIIEEHRVYQQGLLWFYANDPRVPKDIQAKMRTWGLAKDEFTDNGNWPHQIYVREARRMVGKYVMTENELLKRRPTPESVGMGSYTMDSHNIQRYVTPQGYVQNEGDIGVSTRGPYQIAYGSLVPKKQQCENLLAPVCVSSSHIAFGSIRMEPVFMILGQSAATAAVLSLDENLAVQDLPYETLRKRLLADG
ncbi:MAG: FAD-dependent oxidoreductase, partial [Opitutales bacterium]